MFLFFSKCFQTIFQLGNFLLLVQLFGVILLWTRWNKQGKILVTGVTGLFVAIAILPIAEMVAMPLETVFPIPQLPNKIDGIITTCGINPFLSLESGQSCLTYEGETLTEALALARKFPQAKLMFSGGSASLLYGNYNEASAAAIFFQEQGIENSRMMFDEKSSGTQEKAVNCWNLIKPSASATWVLISPAMRMPRTVLAFQKAGWNIIPYPVDFSYHGAKFLNFNLGHSLTMLWAAGKEWLGLIAYRLTGRTSSLFPSNKSIHVSR